MVVISMFQFDFLGRSDADSKLFNQIPKEYYKKLRENSKSPQKDRTSRELTPTPRLANMSLDENANENLSDISKYRTLSVAGKQSHANMILLAQNSLKDQILMEKELFLSPMRSYLSRMQTMDTSPSTIEKDSNLRSRTVMKQREVSISPFEERNYSISIKPIDESTISLPEINSSPSQFKLANKMQKAVKKLVNVRHVLSLNQEIDILKTATNREIG